MKILTSFLEALVLSRFLIPSKNTIECSLPFRGDSENAFFWKSRIFPVENTHMIYF